jgi:hypothetical protein
MSDMGEGHAIAETRRFARLLLKREIHCGK